MQCAMLQFAPLWTVIRSLFLVRSCAPCSWTAVRNSICVTARSVPCCLAVCSTLDGDQVPIPGPIVISMRVDGCLEFNLCDIVTQCNMLPNSLLPDGDQVPILGPSFAPCSWTAVRKSCFVTAVPSTCMLLTPVHCVRRQSRPHVYC